MDSTRRHLLGSASLVGAGLFAPLYAQQQSPSGGMIQLPPVSARTEKQVGLPPQPLPPEERVGFAIVGLGHLSLDQILPAFGEAKKSKLVALVSGDAAKAHTIARQHGLPEKNIYSYQNFDQIRDNPDVQAVYIVLPNSMHEEYTVRGAQAGKHILTEKPMATKPEECQRMIDACAKASRQLMVAYRIQYEPKNRMIQKMVRQQQYGKVKMIDAMNTQNQGDPNQWRQKKALAGGGSLPDVGLYCLNTTRFLLGEEPTEVFASLYSTPNDPRFKEVEENMIWQMRFPSGVLANNATGYGSHESRRYRVYAETAWFGMDPAFSYDGLRVELSRAEGMMEHYEQPQSSPKNQFALEMDHFAECVKNGKRPYTPGEEGLQDHRIMAALYQSAQSGKPVNLAATSKLDQMRGEAPAES